MSSSAEAEECSKLVIGNWLLDIGVSPLPRPLGSLGGCSASCPESSSPDCSADCLVESPASYLDGNWASHSAGCSESSRAGRLESCRERSSPSCSADCPAKRPGSGPENSLPSSSESNLPSYSESYWAECLAGCLRDSPDSTGRDAPRIHHQDTKTPRDRGRSSPPPSPLRGEGE